MSKVNNRKTKCIILAAGAGTRMNTKMPKALHRLGNKAMIVRLIDTVTASGVKDIIVVTGYGSGQVDRYLNSYDVKTVKQARLIGSADAVKSASRYLSGFTGDVLVLYTDTPLIRKKTIKGLLKEHKKSMAACTVLTAAVDDPATYGRIIKNTSGDLIGIIEEKDATSEEKKIKQINVGAYCFDKKNLLTALGKINKNPKKQEFYLTDIVKHLKENKQRVRSFDECSGEEALGINTRADLAKAEKIIRFRKIEKLMREGVTIVDPDTAYIDADVKIGKDTTIYPSVCIEGDVTIGSHCRIGPFAKIRGISKIGDNTVIGNFVEVVRSTLGSNTKVKHHSYLGDAVVGDNVNIGAGAITANYDGKCKNRTIISNDVLIGVGAILIAPVSIGKNSVVGAGSVVTKNKNVPDETVVVGAPARILRGVK